jgi:hypothetical protein
MLHLAAGHRTTRRSAQPRQTESRGDARRALSWRGSCPIAQRPNASPGRGDPGSRLQPRRLQVGSMPVSVHNDGHVAERIAADAPLARTMRGPLAGPSARAVPFPMDVQLSERAQRVPRRLQLAAGMGSSIEASRLTRYACVCVTSLTSSGPSRPATVRPSSSSSPIGTRAASPGLSPANAPRQTG